MEANCAAEKQGIYTPVSYMSVYGKEVKLRTQLFRNTFMN